MDFLKAEIERKKKQLQKTNVLDPGKTYFKRGDLAAKQEEEYWKKHKKQKTETQLDVTETQRTSKSTSNECSSSGLGGLVKNETKEKLSLPRREVIKRLRERVEPIRLFGESDYEASQRLKKIEILEPENKGFRNELKDAFDRVDMEYVNEVASSEGVGTSSFKSTDVRIKEVGMSKADFEEMTENLGQGDNERDSEILLKFLKYILQLWGEDLNSRAAEQKRSMRGKLASATHSQTVDYLKPLFRKLKTKSLDPQILVCMVDVVKHLLDRNYLRANDAYLEMAIGNAPWPIGVTMVGIHARTGRENIWDKNVAHVLNDETQRKYIQGLKRLMTNCQRFFPTDPSRMVNYERPKDL